jgi:hypothetical protein
LTVKHIQQQRRLDLVALAQHTAALYTAVAAAPNQIKPIALHSTSNAELAMVRM